MFVSRKTEYRVQRWDGSGWRQGMAYKTNEAAAAALKEKYKKHPEWSLRLITITTTVESGAPIGPPVKTPQTIG